MLLSRSGPGFDSRSGQVSWVRFFWGFSSPIRQMSQTVPRHHLAIIIIFIIFALFKYECGCEWCLCLYVRVVSEVALALS
ncbi:hypothetical protein C0J52_22880 [Blattella germanica]|nr:hypothetical protein C0J52_22880 [Blattella germanica]